MGEWRGRGEVRGSYAYRGNRARARVSAVDAVGAACGREPLARSCRAAHLRQVLMTSQAAHCRKKKVSRMIAAMSEVIQRKQLQPQQHITHLRMPVCALCLFFCASCYLFTIIFACVAHCAPTTAVPARVALVRLRIAVVWPRSCSCKARADVCKARSGASTRTRTP